jgi:hypothetical protein
VSLVDLRADVSLASLSLSFSSNAMDKCLDNNIEYGVFQDDHWQSEQQVAHGLIVCQLMATRSADRGRRSTFCKTDSWTGADNSLSERAFGL